MEIECNSVSLDERIKCFKINNNKIILVDTFRLIVINVKTKQIVTNINCLCDINCLSVVNGFILAGQGNGIITQINSKALKIINYFKIKNESHYKIEKDEKYFKSIIDMGDGKFCILSNITGLCLYKYSFL